MIHKDLEEPEELAANFELFSRLRFRIIRWATLTSEFLNYFLKSLEDATRMQAEWRFL
jgi:hypothetical protein